MSCKLITRSRNSTMWGGFALGSLLSGGVLLIATPAANAVISCVAPDDASLLKDSQNVPVIKSRLLEYDYGMIGLSFGLAPSVFQSSGSVDTNGVLGVMTNGSSAYAVAIAPQIGLDTRFKAGKNIMFTEFYAMPAFGLYASDISGNNLNASDSNGFAMGGRLGFGRTVKRIGNWSIVPTGGVKVDYMDYDQIFDANVSPLRNKLLANNLGIMGFAGTQVEFLSSDRRQYVVFDVNAAAGLGVGAFNNISNIDIGGRVSVGLGFQHKIHIGNRAYVGYDIKSDVNVLIMPNSGLVNRTIEVTNALSNALRTKVYEVIAGNDGVNSNRLENIISGTIAGSPYLTSSTFGSVNRESYAADMADAIVSNVLNRIIDNYFSSGTLDRSTLERPSLTLELQQYIKSYILSHSTKISTSDAEDQAKGLAAQLLSSDSPGETFFKNSPIDFYALARDDTPISVLQATIINMASMAQSYYGGIADAAKEKNHFALDSSQASEIYAGHMMDKVSANPDKQSELLNNLQSKLISSFANQSPSSYTGLGSKYTSNGSLTANDVLSRNLNYIEVQQNYVVSAIDNLGQLIKEYTTSLDASSSSNKGAADIFATNNNDGLQSKREVIQNLYNRIVFSVHELETYVTTLTGNIQNGNMAILAGPISSAINYVLNSAATDTKNLYDAKLNTMLDSLLVKTGSHAIVGGGVGYAINLQNNDAKSHQSYTDGEYAKLMDGGVDAVSYNVYEALRGLPLLGSTLPAAANDINQDGQLTKAERNVNPISGNLQTVKAVDWQTMVTTVRDRYTDNSSVIYSGLMKETVKKIQDAAISAAGSNSAQTANAENYLNLISQSAVTGVNFYFWQSYSGVISVVNKLNSILDSKPTGDATAVNNWWLNALGMADANNDKIVDKNARLNSSNAVDTDAKGDPILPQGVTPQIYGLSSTSSVGYAINNLFFVLQGYYGLHSYLGNANARIDIGQSPWAARTMPSVIMFQSFLSEISAEAQTLKTNVLSVVGGSGAANLIAIFGNDEILQKAVKDLSDSVVDVYKWDNNQESILSQAATGSVFNATQSGSVPTADSLQMKLWNVASGNYDAANGGSTVLLTTEGIGGIFSWYESRDASGVTKAGEYLSDFRDRLDGVANEMKERYTKTMSQVSTVNNFVNTIDQRMSTLTNEGGIEATAASVSSATAAPSVAIGTYTRFYAGFSFGMEF